MSSTTKFGFLFSTPKNTHYSFKSMKFKENRNNMGRFWMNRTCYEDEKFCFPNKSKSTIYKSDNRNDFYEGKLTPIKKFYRSCNDNCDNINNNFNNFGYYMNYINQLKSTNNKFNKILLNNLYKSIKRKNESSNFKKRTISNERYYKALNSLRKYKMESFDIEKLRKDERERKLILSNINMRNKMLKKKGLLFNQNSFSMNEEPKPKNKLILDANKNETKTIDGKTIKLQLKLPKLILNKDNICVITASGVDYNILSPQFKAVEYKKEN